MIIILGIILGLIINYITGGLPFSTLICIAAAIFIILPSLLNIKKEAFLQIIKNKKRIILISLIVNFFVLPIIGGLLRYLFFGKTNIEILYGILLLSIIPGGGLLVTYLKLSKSDLNLGITIFGINLLFFGLYFIPFTILINHLDFKNNAGYKNISFKKDLNNNTEINNIFNNFQTNEIFSKIVNNKKTQTKCIIEKTTKKLGINLSNCFTKNRKINPLIGLYGFLILVVFPLFLLLIIKYIKLYPIFKKFSPIISKIGTFAIITYIFSLEQIREILNIKSKEILLKIILLTITFYIVIYVLGYLIANNSSNYDKEKYAIFWNITTRFLTLGLIISTVYAYYLNNFLITTIFLISYFIQITLSAIIVNILKRKLSN